MGNVAITVENLSKIYRLGNVGSETLAEDFKKIWKKITGKYTHNYLDVDKNIREKASESNYVWALKDLNFEVNQGEILGIIGKNGSGKSTLLKLLSRITAPTTGKITINGRVASLLEVGTGFHLDLTGRENIFLNGAILGMTKQEIKSKFDEIVEFSGCARYIDTPVKRYSSGMKVRLGFAVAAFLEPEILIVDEVLAVGDFEFQKKCLGKMKDVSRNEGRTVLFVSHNMEAIQTLCTRGMVLQEGEIVEITSAQEAINLYIKQFISKEPSKIWIGDDRPGTLDFKWERVSVTNDQGSPPPFYTHENIVLEFQFEVKDLPHKDLSITYYLYDERGILVYMGSSAQFTDCEALPNSRLIFRSTLPGNILHYGSYSIGKLLVILDKAYLYHEMQDVLTFEILPSPHNFRLGGIGKKEGVILLPHVTWDIQIM